MFSLSIALIIKQNYDITVFRCISTYAYAPFATPAVSCEIQFLRTLSCHDSRVLGKFRVSEIIPDLTVKCIVLRERLAQTLISNS